MSETLCRESQIPRVVKDLQASIKELVTIVGVLRERISTCLQQDIPPLKGCEEQINKETKVGLAQVLYEQKEDIVKATQQIQNMINCCEL